MAYLFDYLAFLAEAVTVVVALLIIASAIFGMSQRGAVQESGGRLRVEKVNEQLRNLRYTMEYAILPASRVKHQHKAEAKEAKQAEKKALKGHKVASETAPAAPASDQATPSTIDAQQASTAGDAGEDVKSGQSGQSEQSEQSGQKGRVFCLRFDGDVEASAVNQLRSEVSAILTIATPSDEVVVVIESPGGMVSNYGLAASQLTRFRTSNIPLTVVVDKVAASGGYLMAVVANKIVSAPFALVGSIGVVAEVPNVHRLLKKNDVDVEVITAGKHKRTLTLLGENTDEGRQKFQQELQEVHDLFQTFVATYRPEVELATVATGEAWYGTQALDLKLVDELATSDDYLTAACDEHDVYYVKWEELRKPFDRLMERVNGIAKQLELVITKFTTNNRNDLTS